ncbi:hypothetical protein ACFQO7_12765 [Catellatospora aurea]|uniref:YD repeat-containing protein n=1 Tax=Catellatospora aurea TaxID=1337874 RepID=A0ABW2GY61_9ACTN
MSSTYGYDRDGFLTEFFPDQADRAEVEAGAEHLVNVSRADLCAEVPEQPGPSQVSRP